MCPQTTTNKHSAEDFENQISALKTLFGDVVDYVYFLPPKRSKYFASLELSLLIDSVCIENSLPHASKVCSDELLNFSVAHAGNAPKRRSSNLL